jgi:hypothetical protein
MSIGVENCPSLGVENCPTPVSKFLQTHFTAIVTRSRRAVAILALLKTYGHFPKVRLVVMSVEVFSHVFERR